MLALQHLRELLRRDPRMLAGDRLGTAAFTAAEGIEQRPVLLLGDDQDVAGIRARLLDLTECR